MLTLNRITQASALLLAMVGALGCGGDEAVAHSGAITLQLSGIKEGDATSGMFSQDKSVSTESGNPYAVFLRDARDALGGEDPAYIGVTKFVARIHADSDGVVAFDEVFDDMEAFVGDSTTTIAIGAVEAPSSSEVQIQVSSDTDYTALQEALKSGSFKLGVRGPSTATPPEKFDLRISIEAHFEALP